MMYNEQIMNEFFNPQNVGVIKGASGKGKTVSEKDTEIMKIYIQVEGDKIVNAMFQTFGCVVAIAATSVATRLIIGKTLEEANAITGKDIINELGGKVPDNKRHLVEMAVETVYDAVKSYERKQKGEKVKDEDDD